MAGISTDANISAILMTEQGSTPTTPATNKRKPFFKSDGFYYVDDAGIVYPIRMDTKTHSVMASEMWPSTTSGSAALAQTELASNKVNFKSLDFDTTTIEYAEFSVWMPDDWVAGTMTFKAVWTAASGSGTVIWALQARAFADDDALDGAWGTAITVTDTLLAANDVHYSPQSSAMTIANTPAAGELVQFRVYRDTSDTLGVDAKLLGIKLYYT